MPKQICEQLKDGSVGFIDTPDNVNEFLKEYEALCKKRNLSFAHEDKNGAFEITKFSEDNIKWVNDAILVHI